jgi:hypothetical protein
MRGVAHPHPLPPPLLVPLLAHLNGGGCQEARGLRALRVGLLRA